MPIRYLTGVNIDSNTLFVDSTNNRVGIGTDSPSRQLELVGSDAYIQLTRSSASTQATLGFNTGATNDWLIRTGDGSTSNLQFYSYGTSSYVMTIARSSGNVGIGTTSPVSPLDVNGIISSRGIFVAQNSGTYNLIYNASNSVSMYLGGSADQGNYYDNTTHYFRSSGGSSTYAVINYLGNVGIGTTAPGVKLDVLGVATIRDSSGGGALNIGTSSGRTQYQYITLGGGNGGVDYGWQIGRSPQTGGVINDGFYIYDIKTNNTPFAIALGGNVGIGTTSPAYKLDVNGEINARSNSQVSGNAQVFTIDGTNHAYYAWSVAGSRKAYAGFGSSGSTTFELINENTGGFIIGTNGSQQFIITSAGNVGIGTTSPTQKLDVNGYSRATSGFVGSTTLKLFGDNSSTEFVAVNTNGSVQMTSYGGGSITGTVAYNLAVDSSGNIIETAGGVVDGSGTANYVSKWSDANTLTNSLLYDNGSTISIGLGSTTPSYTNAYGYPQFAIESNAFASSHVFTHNDTNGNYSFFALGKSKGTAAAPTIVESSEIIGAYQFWAYDGSAYREMASIISNVDGTPGAGDMPGNLRFSTTSDGASSPTERMRITAAGNVGIGTTSPVSIGAGVTTLDIQGSSSGGVAFGPSGIKNYIYGASTMYIEAHTTAVFTTSGTEKMRLTTGGQFIVGGTTVGYSGTKLQVGNTSDAQNGLNILTSTTGYGYILFGDGEGADTYVGQIWYYHGDNYMGFQTNGSEKLRITSAGNVGIGTTAPQYKLDVAQVIRSSYGSNEGAIYLGSTPAGVAYVAGAVRAAPSPSYSYTGKISLYTTTWGVGSDYGITEQMYIETSAADTKSATAVMLPWGGNVGIGTTSPAAKLDVNGTISASGEINSISNNARISLYRSTGTNYFDWSSGQPLYFSTETTAGGSGRSTKMVLLDNGNVGIGTTSPATKLHIVGYSRTDGGLLLNGSDADYREMIFTTSSAARWNLYAYGGEGGSNAGSVLYLARYADNGDYIANVATFLRTNGYVGIATITPTQQLHVSGNIRVTGAYYDSSNSAGSSGQVLSSTGSGTAWVNQGEATAISLYDLLPAARTTYAWTVQLTAGTWADIFSSNTVLSNGTWMVQAFVNDYAVGGQQYSETYSGVMSWGEASSTNQGGNQAVSEIVLHRSGHAANSGNFYLRTVERVTSTLLFQGMSNQTYSAASTINFKFVKIF